MCSPMAVSLDAKWITSMCTTYRDRLRSSFLYSISTVLHCDVCSVNRFNTHNLFHLSSKRLAGPGVACASFETSTIALTFNYVCEHFPRRGILGVCHFNFPLILSSVRLLRRRQRTHAFPHSWVRSRSATSSRARWVPKG